MPRLGTPLDTGDTLPALTVPLVGGGAARLPEAGRWSVLLLYRGHW